MKFGNAGKWNVVFITLALGMFTGLFSSLAQTIPVGIQFHPLQFQTTNSAALNPVTPINITTDTNLQKLNAWLRQKLANRNPPGSNKLAKLLTNSQFSATTTNDEEEYWFRANGTPSFIKVKSNQHRSNALTKLDEAERDVKVRDFIKNRQKNLKINDPDDEFQINHRKQDTAGRYHYRLQQVFKGIKIWGGEAIVHLESDGTVGSMDAALIPSPKGIATNPVVLLSNAVAAVNQKYYVGKGKILGKGELVIDGAINRQPRLAWLFSAGSNPIDPRRFLVDAISGEIINSVALVENGAVTGSGVDALGYPETLNLWQNGGNYYMVDTTKPMYAITSAPPSYSSSKGTITIADFGHSQDWSTANYAMSSSPSSGWIPDAVSASYDLSKVYDFYHSQFGRNSYDDAGSSLLGGVRFGTGYPNAYWSNQENAMSYGDGYSAALDVCGHEVTHGVIFSIGDGGILDYQNQPGALNEALADIFGECVEAKAIGNNDWLMGTHLASGALRNLADPSSMIIAGNRPYPSKMSEFIQPNDSFLNNFLNQDNGGVHMNSLIFSHCFYLLAQGLNGALGLPDAEKIFYQAMTLHMLKQTQFIDARHACITSAEELYGAGSIQSLKTAEAFDKVEIYDTPPTAPSSTIPAVQAPDSTLCLRLDNNGYYSLFRKETAMGDSSTGSFIGTIHYLDANRVSVSGNGADAVFTTVDNDFGYVGTDATGAELAGYPGYYYSAAISPDGSRIALVLLNQYTGNPENQIKIINLNTSVNQTFTLYGQTSEGNYLDIVDYADVMDFTADGRYLIYDAYCKSTTATGDILDGWTIFALDTTTGTIQTLVDLNTDYDIGDPALGNTHQNWVTLDVYNKSADQSTIYSYNLTTGKAGVVGTVDGLGVPGFNGDDSAIIYSLQDPTVLSGYSLVKQGLATDGITKSGSATWWLKDADYGVIYRRGFFTPYNSAPQVDLASPNNGQVFSAPTNILIQASASDPDGTISKVEFYFDSTKIAEDTTAPYAFTLNKVAIGQHRITVRAIDNFGASTDSASHLIYVLTPPSIVAQPIGKTVLVGSNVTLNATISGTAPLNFQWNKNGINIPNATNGSFNLPSAQTNDSGIYTVTVGNMARTVTSLGAKLTVLAPIGILNQPTNQTVLVSNSAAFSVAVGGTAPFSYQWKKTAIVKGKAVTTILKGATNTFYLLAAAKTNDAANYFVVIKNPAGSVTSSVASLTVLVPASFTLQAGNRSVILGTNTTFRVAVKGTAPFNYQWLKDGIPLADGGNVVGANSNSLGVTSVTTNENGSYSVIVSNIVNTIVSSNALLTVLLPPSITVLPTNQVGVVSNSVTFAVTVTGTAPFRYQWKKGTVLIKGATNATFTLGSVKLTDAATNYSVVVTGPGGSVTSPLFTLSVVTTSLAAKPIAVNAIPSIAPTIGIAVQDKNLLITWSTNFTGFKLVSSTNLTFWDSNLPLPAITDTNFVSTNSMDVPNKFFRLTK
jgi:Zn-dependent metalloprotease